MENNEENEDILMIRKALKILKVFLTKKNLFYKKRKNYKMLNKLIDTLKNNRPIYNIKVICDESNNSEKDIELNNLNINISLNLGQPKKLYKVEKQNGCGETYYTVYNDFSVSSVHCNTFNKEYYFIKSTVEENEKIMWYAKYEQIPEGIEELLRLIALSHLKS